LAKHERTALDRARDELFSHINRCGVLEATDDQQQEWMDDTLKFLEERYPDLSGKDLQELEQVGLRYCKPVIRHGKQHTASSEWVETGSGSAA
jgi:hypothetical protein